MVDGCRWGDPDKAKKIAEQHAQYLKLMNHFGVVVRSPYDGRSLGLHIRIDVYGLMEVRFSGGGLSLLPCACSVMRAIRKTNKNLRSEAFNSNEELLIACSTDIHNAYFVTFTVGALDVIGIGYLHASNAGDCCHCRDFRDTVVFV